MKIIDSVWFTEMMSNTAIGIVVGYDETTEETKAYIGTAPGKVRHEDEACIMARGAKFPLDAAMKVIRRAVRP